MQFFKQRSRNVAQLVGLELKGSRVEASAPTQLAQNRFQLRCECGAEFFATTPTIRSAESNRSTLTCQPCRDRRKQESESNRDKELEAQKREVKRRSARCPHGFVVELNICERCKICCVLCGDQHASKLCTTTEVGKRRLAERGAA